MKKSLFLAALVASLAGCSAMGVVPESEALQKTCRDPHEQCRVITIDQLRYWYDGAYRNGYHDGQKSM